jgi:hypothetical protein
MRRMGKKAIVISLSLVLILSVVNTAVLTLAQDESSPQVQRMERALSQELESALTNGLITQELADRIISTWEQQADDKLPQLFQRIMNLIKSREEAQIEESSFLHLIRQAVNQGILTPGKARYAVGLWEQKTPKERTRLYQRLHNLVSSGR